jgi:L-serine dehydratase
MRAAGFFARDLSVSFPQTSRIVVKLYGSLAWTGRAHATDKAVILGLSGELPDRVDPDHGEELFRSVSNSMRLDLSGESVIVFSPTDDIVFDTQITFSRHPNAMTFTALDSSGRILKQERWYSIGGGFVEREGDEAANRERIEAPAFPYTNAASMLQLGEKYDFSIPAMVLRNETRFRTDAETFLALDSVTGAMFACIDRGLSSEGILPGGLQVRRRAKALVLQLDGQAKHGKPMADNALRYVAAFAIAVNEENACGGRVVTAPTNGAAGVIPAVLRYYRDFCAGTPEGIRRFMLAAAAVGGIIKRNASISGAEVGCQGEVGAAAAMAAAGLTTALEGSNEQIENAAEIAIEHHLGMTCDPVGGLVQIPCIERNAFGAVKAITAASLALQGDGTHLVSLDQAIETMRQTGADMSSKYRETSRGGLAVNVPEC